MVNIYKTQSRTCACIHLKREVHNLVTNVEYVIKRTYSVLIAFSSFADVTNTVCLGRPLRGCWRSTNIECLWRGYSLVIGQTRLHPLTRPHPLSRAKTRKGENYIQSHVQCLEDGCWLQKLSFVCQYSQTVQPKLFV